MGMERLPPEISRIDCGLVGIKDIQSLRLVSTLYSKLATPFLLSEVQLVLHPDSFERLLAISRHSEISKLVKTLYYEPDALDKIDRQNNWEKSIFDKRNLNSIRERPLVGARDEDLRHTDKLLMSSTGGQDTLTRPRSWMQATSDIRSCIETSKTLKEHGTETENW